MDLSKIDTKAAATEGRKMELLGPDGVPLFKKDGKTPITITLLGKDSDAYNARVFAITNRRIQQMQRNVKTTAEAQRLDATKLLAHCTVAWDGVGIGEDETECTFENAVRLYSEVEYIREQVDVFIGSRENFLKASQTS